MISLNSPSKDALWFRGVLAAMEVLVLSAIAQLHLIHQPVGMTCLFSGFCQISVSAIQGAGRDPGAWKD